MIVVVFVKVDMGCLLIEMRMLFGWIFVLVVGDGGLVDVYLVVVEDVGMMYLFIEVIVVVFCCMLILEMRIVKIMMVRRRFISGLLSMMIMCFQMGRWQKIWFFVFFVMVLLFVVCVFWMSDWNILDVGFVFFDGGYMFDIEMNLFSGSILNLYLVLLICFDYS